MKAEKIREAMAKKMREQGYPSFASIAKEIKGSTARSISRLLNKEVDTISDNHGEQYLKWLGEEYRPVADQSIDKFGCWTPIPESSPVRPVHKHELTEVPILGFAQASGFDPVMESINDYTANCSDEYALFSEVKEGYFALRVEGQSMAPAFPNGTLLLVAGGEFPQRGDLVVAKLSDNGGMIVVKRYNRKDGIVTLESENPGGDNFTIDTKKEVGRIIWMHPAIDALINLRARRNGNGAR